MFLSVITWKKNVWKKSKRMLRTFLEDKMTVLIWYITKETVWGLITWGLRNLRIICKFGGSSWVDEDGNFSWSYNLWGGGITWGGGGRNNKKCQLLNFFPSKINFFRAQPQKIYLSSHLGVYNTLGVGGFLLSEKIN